MDITITGRNWGSRTGSRLRDREGREGRPSRRQGPRARDQGHAATTRRTASTGDDRVELTLIGPGPLVRAEAARRRQVRRVRPRDRQADRAHPPGQGPPQGAPRPAPPDVAARGVRRRLQRRRHHARRAPRCIEKVATGVDPGQSRPRATRRSTRPSSSARRCSPRAA